MHFFAVFREPLLSDFVNPMIGDNYVRDILSQTPGSPS